jgi:hypothetical protein
MELANTSTAQFDLSNPQHLAMRKQMVNIYTRYVSAMNKGYAETMAIHLGMALGLERVATYVLFDPALGCLCTSLYISMHDLGRASQAEVAA